jgi:hypothetical protein
MLENASKTRNAKRETKNAQDSGIHVFAFDVFPSGRFFQQPVTGAPKPDYGYRYGLDGGRLRQSWIVPCRF